MSMASRNGTHAMTVLGPVATEDLGVTLVHEHLFVDLTCYWQDSAQEPCRSSERRLELTNLGEIREYPFISRENCILDDTAIAIDEVSKFKSLGGMTIVDVTLPEIGRDVSRLQQVAHRTGLNIIAGCGHYIYLTHPTGLEHESVEAIAERLISELTDGIEQTGGCAGIIGEIGTSDPLHPTEEKVLRAAAKAQTATGAAISVHLHPTAQLGHDVLSILESEGADPSRVVLGHLDISFGVLGFADGLAYHRSLANRGCLLEYDTCGKAPAYMRGSSYSRPFWIPSDRDRVEGIVKLVESGFGQQLVLSQDVCFKYELTAYGGSGYGHVLRHFTTYLQDYGMAEHELNELLIDNPRRLLALST